MIDINVTVGNYTGINIDNESLIYGTLLPSSSASRDINLTNGPVISSAHIDSIGYTSKWINIGENDFRLMPNEVKSVPIKISIPSDADYGNYTGTLRITLRRI